MKKKSAALAKSSSSPRSAALASLNAELGKVGPFKGQSSQQATEEHEEKRTVEMEYAHNLQQQIYFLELECQYLKMGGGGGGGGMADGGERGGKGMQMSFHNQLQHMKETYDQMEHAQNNEIASLKLQLEAANEKILLLNSNIDKLKTDLQEKDFYMEATEAENNQKWDELIALRINIEKKNSILEKNLEFQTKEKESLRAELREKETTLGGENKKLKAAIAEAKDTATSNSREREQLQNELNSWQLRAAEGVDQLEKAKAMEHTAREFAEKQTELYRETLSKLHTIEIKLSQEQVVSRQTQEHCTRLLDNVNKLERQTKELESNLNTAAELRESAQQQLIESGIQCNALRRQAENDEEALRIAKKIAMESKERDEHYRMQMETMTLEMSEAKASLDAALASKKASLETQDTLDALNTKIQAVNERQEHQLNDLKSRNVALIAELETSRENAKKVEIEMNRLRSKDEKKKDLEMIDLEEMKNLVQSNMQAVSTIDKFMQKYGNNLSTE